MLRTLLLSLLLVAFTGQMLAQAPDAFQYQAAIRDSEGNIRANESLTVSIGILQGSATGTLVYEEDHDVTTSDNGLITLAVGKGNSGNSGPFSDLADIEWSDGPYFIEVSVDGDVMGTSELLSVPYAEHAASLKTDKNVEIDAEVHTPERTGEANMLPIAYGMVRANGSIEASSGNFSISKNEIGQYDILIEGESYFFTNYIASATLNQEGTIRTTSNGGRLVVYTYEDTQPADKNFYFVVFKP